MDTLIQTLAVRCQQMFEEAGKAAARSAVLVAGRDNATTEVPDTPQSAGDDLGSVPLIRERTVEDETKASDYEFSTCRRSLAERINSRTIFFNTLQSGHRMTVGGPTVSPLSPPA